MNISQVTGLELTVDVTDPFACRFETSVVIGVGNEDKQQFRNLSDKGVQLSVAAIELNEQLRTCDSIFDAHDTIFRDSSRRVIRFQPLVSLLLLHQSPAMPELRSQLPPRS